MTADALALAARTPGSMPVLTVGALVALSGREALAAVAGGCGLLSDVPHAAAPTAIQAEATNHANRTGESATAMLPGKRPARVWRGCRPG